MPAISIHYFKLYLEYLYSLNFSEMESIDGENNCSRRRNSQGYGSGTFQYIFLLLKNGNEFIAFYRKDVSLWTCSFKMV